MCNIRFRYPSTIEIQLVKHLLTEILSEEEYGRSTKKKTFHVLSLQYHPKLKKMQVTARYPYFSKNNV